MYQSRINEWMHQAFSKSVVDDPIERNMRFIEEALELVQSLGMTAETAQEVLNYVYGRPLGEPSQEVGGVMFTLASLCNAQGLDLEKCAHVELERVDTPEMILRIRERAKRKPHAIRGKDKGL